MIANKQVVEELANTLADRIVNKMLTSQPVLTDATRALKTVRSPGLPRTYVVGNSPRSAHNDAHLNKGGCLQLVNS